MFTMLMNCKKVLQINEIFFYPAKLEPQNAFQRPVSFNADL